MKITVRKTDLPDVLIIEPEYFSDARGFFMEVYRQDVFAEHGLPTSFVQLNHSGSVRNTIRGLHFQWEPPMGKLMRVTSGAAFLVAVDIRKGSPTFGKWVGREITAESRAQLWAPAGFARGFCVLSEFAEVQYLCTGVYNQNGESGIRWNDPAIGIDWPDIKDPIISGKDQVAQTLAEWSEKQESNHFTY